MGRIKPQALLQQSKKKKGPARISVMTIIMSSLIVVLTLFFLYATYRHWSQRSRFQIENKQSVLEGDNSFMDPKKSDLPGYAILETAKGSITVELFKDSSPEVVDQFLDLCLKHEAFMLGTSKAKHDKRGFELFITTAPIPDLNEKLIVFGKVVKGEDVVQEIEEVDTDEHFRPKSNIGIHRVTLKQSI
ncbi:hypothetical protein QUC31_004975 [Theobroma cacao]|nr:Cyclophilin-type peptidyl-prolyl cis-trans isomerase domain - like 5 [Theobroma cacao]